MNNSVKKDFIQNVVEKEIQGALFHSNQCVHYTHPEYQKRVREIRFRQSTSICKIIIMIVINEHSKKWLRYNTGTIF